MKKIYQKIKLHKFKSDVINVISGEEFFVLFEDGTYKYCVYKGEVYDLLKNDHIRPIRYIFDCADRISLSREILIEDYNKGED